MLLWDTFFDAGEAQLKKGKYGKAEQLLKSALGEANSFEPDDPRLLKTLLALISVYQSNKRPKDAEPHLRRAEELISPPSTVDPSAQSDVVRAQLRQLEFEEPDPHATTITSHERRPTPPLYACHHHSPSPRAPTCSSSSSVRTRPSLRLKGLAQPLRNSL